MYVIYALIDPRDQRVRYVGITRDVLRRFIYHMTRLNGQNPEKDAWIRALMADQCLATMHTLERVETRRQAREREIHWIRHYQAAGVDLLNITAASGSYRMMPDVTDRTEDPPKVEGMPPDASYQLQYRRCGKPSCTVCNSGSGHGPYWYVYYRDGNGKLHSRYIGKNAPAAMP